MASKEIVPKPKASPTEKRGRPSEYDPEIADLICEEIATTTRGLDFICSQNSNFPSSRTIHRWLNQNRDFCQAYVRARVRQADMLFDQCIDIADDNLGDFVWREGKGSEPGWWQFNGEAVARAKLKIETRMRVAGKLAPKKYGDKIELEHEIGEKAGDTLATLLSGLRRKKQTEKEGA